MINQFARYIRRLMPQVSMSGPGELTWDFRACGKQNPSGPDD